MIPPWKRRNSQSLSPLILILVFITSFNHVLGRHRVRHHRDRFKRQQGAHLYLAGSYVYDGGEGPDAGPWTDWSSPSPCSRTCGGGVSTEQRQCQPGYVCQGSTTRHVSCNTQDCPDVGDFRAQQCSEFDNVPFEGVFYQWIPYTKAPNPCELNCMPRGERFYYRQKLQVTDGTRCNDESFDVCVQGKCQPVGCDMMLGSDAREDRCRICGGDGSTCNTVSGRLDMQDLQVGYNDILLIPAGATNVNVHEIEPSNNYLAIRNTTGHYYLNGNWRIDFPRTMEFAGTKFDYQRYPQEFSAPDRISCLGPTDEGLFIVLLFQDRNVGVDYEYSLPTNIVPGSETETYAWTFDQFTPCTATCGGGVQYRNVTCAGRRTLEPADRSLCDSSNEPPTQQRCGEVPCQAGWVPYPWGSCSAPCGVGGVQTREISCQQIVSNGYSTIVDDAECERIQPKPPQRQLCNQGKVCAQWHTSPWKPCDHLCGDGKETRTVTCYRKDKDKVEALDDAECESSEPKPESERACNLRPCEGVDWITSEWSGCDKCGLTNETRKAQCATADGKVHPDNLCEEDQKPELVRQCATVNTSCEYLWYASQWSECSAECGQGVQTRTLFCGTKSEDGEVKTVEKDKCDQKRTYETIKNCTSEVEKCPGEWFSGPWTECSKECGGGEKTKKVVCLRDNQVVDVSECDADKIIFAKEDCNTQACSEDTIIPTDVTKSVDESEGTGATEEPMTSEAPSDDYVIEPDDTCDDGEWVGDDEDWEEEETEATPALAELGFPTDEGGTTETSETSFSMDDLMMSDATASTSESDVTGSGDGELTSPSSESSKSSDMSESTLEGSGDTSATEASVITETFETDTAIELDSSSSMSEGSTEASVSGSTDESGMTDGSDSTKSSGSSDSSPESSSSMTTEAAASGATDASSSASGATDASSAASGETDASAAASGATDASSDSATESSSESSTETSTDMSSTSESSTDISSTSESSSSSESASSTDAASSAVSESETSSAASSTTESEDGTTPFPDIVESDLGPQATTKKEGSSESTESTIEFTGSTESESTGGSTDMSGSTEMPGSTESLGSTESAGSTESPGSTESLGSTESPGSTESTESVATESTTEFTGSTESTTEFTGSTDVDIWSSTTESGPTEETEDVWSTTPIMDIFETRAPRMCKRKKEKDCKKTKYGCCWDKVTPAEGPFDKGCPTPKTCKESKFGCCEDGVSPALGRKFKGCPSTHCNETLFGCCPDNTTASQGNNDEGCPPPPPACLKAKYGCCKDNVTVAKGPKKKGCEPEPTPASAQDCGTTTYGCCPDGKKTAKGEFFKGCDIFKKNCKESYFGCCPDEKSSAEGPNYKGCKTACGDSPYGCCSDGITPAHGYSGEGCCLAGPHGCCPDNISPARGPNLEGCGCQYSPFRCCPDNTTAARGHNNEGCGCQYTEHGCCPDEFTPAAGSEYQGCLCHTYQFGCCPDGVTVAKGPHQQGCGCRNSEFGCCSDDSTPAQGPNFAGCGCDATKYGCCPDGVSEAGGENFEGCQDIPINHQDACTQPKERGSCRNYTVKWFFDMDYGGCSRFWYGGCDGNDNRFRSKEECDGICVKPEGTERCNLPKIPGPCEGYYPSWFYDKDRKYCSQFVYGGCLGNNNKFETREECNSLCVKDSSVDACEQEKDEGPCKGQYRRWYFDKTSQSCQQFAYGGCKANNNNFPTEEACKQQCAAPGRKKDHCSLPRAQGNCTSKEPRWFYDIPEKRCLPFYYSGCNGNDNNFGSREACETDCPTEVEKDLCHLPAESGTCGNYTERWYFDTREKACRQFYYGGCDGNGNNFEREEECEQRCQKRPEPPVRPPEPAPAPSEDLCNLPSETGGCADYTLRWHYDAKEQACRQFYYGGCEGNGNNFERQEECEQRCQRRQPPVPATAPPDEPFQTEMCYLPSDTGACQQYGVKYFYDRADGVCKAFTYGGCGGNKNNFNSNEECLQFCANSQDLCSLPPVVGPCNSEYEQYYYDPRTDACQTFNYGGCGGNYNRFQDRASCEQRCRRAPPPAPVEPQTQAPDSNQPVDALCYESADPGNCTDNQSAFFFDVSTRTCTPFTYTGCGGNANRFNSEEQCERQCGSFRGQQVCELQVDPGPCRGYFAKYYYDKNAGRCGPFAYGGCGGNGNRFSSNEECEQICVTHEDKKPDVSQTAICRLPVDSGSCQDGYHKRWYFDDSRGECIAFIYSGCGGNFNNFKTFQSCVDYCREYLAVTPPPVTDQDHPCQAHFDECATLRCPYGIEAYVDGNGCNRCQCHNPCSNVSCPGNTQCAIDINRNRTSSEDPNFIAVCRETEKEGQCPNLQQSDNNCEQECRTDADCALDLKCCSTGCGTSCVVPITVPGELVTLPYLPAYTEPPVSGAFAPPKVDMQTFEPEVHGLIGDQVTLRCAVTGNPSPRISWKKDDLVIDGTQAKYRIKLDQSLQIITLHKTDSGIYLCTAENNIGDPITNEIKLDVVDGPPRSATILDQEDEPDVVASFNAPATLNCLALGFPFPAVTWWKEDSLIPLKTSQFEVRKDYSLLIHSVKLSNLGIYTCQAYNGIGKAASWSVTVKARGPYLSTNPSDEKYLRYIVNPPEAPTTYSPPYVWPVYRPTNPPQIHVPENNQIGPEYNETEQRPQQYPIVPVTTNITMESQRYPVGSEILIPCTVNGYPTPQVQWYKDGVPIYSTNRIHVIENHALVVQQAEKADSGLYECEAANVYSRSESTVTILIDGMYIHPSCKDNKFFANCSLIVQHKYCAHKYYARFCCRSCTEAGLLAVDGPHLNFLDKQAAISDNLV